MNYTPQPWSIPSLVIAHLKVHGGHILQGELAAHFRVGSQGVSTMMRPAIDAGLLVRHEVGVRTALSLPDYTPPAGLLRPRELAKLYSRLDFLRERERHLVAAIDKLRGQLAKT